MTTTPVIAAIPTDVQTFYAYLQSSGAPHPWPRVYEGSVESTCALCDQSVQVGPRSQQALQDMPEAILICFLCVTDPRLGTIRSATSLGNKHPDE